MYFLIDLENVHNAGMRGVELLDQNDTVVLFFSGSCRMMESGVFEELVGSGCNIDLVELKQSGKNALDFYIATYVGEIFGKNDDIKLLSIVSNDKGYSAIRDFWSSRKSNPRTVVVRGSLIQCISAAKENNYRTARATSDITMIDIAKAYSETYFGEGRGVTKKRFNVFKNVIGGFVDADHLKRLVQMVDDRVPRLDIYHYLVKSYGRDKGLKCYNLLKKHTLV